MYRKLILPIVFVLMLIAQWLIPIKMLFINDTIVKEGRAFKFRTMPIDPNDVFRGKYIHLNYDNTRFCMNKVESFKQEEKVYVSIDNDKEGYAKISDISYTKPTSPSYIITTINSIQVFNEDSICINVDFPFDRYYMEESKSKEAEKIYRASLDNLAIKVCSIVYIKEGNAILTDVKINDKSIKDLVQQK